MSDLFPWLSEHTIRVLSMIGAWLSPPITILGTLWLARRSERLRLRIKVRLDRDYILAAVGSKTITGNIIVFSVTNTSRHPVTLESVGWAYREKWRLHVKAEPGTRLPLKLERGEHKEMKFDVGESTARWVLPYHDSARAFVQTATGRKTARIDPSVLKFFLPARASDGEPESSE